MKKTLLKKTLFSAGLVAMGTVGIQSAMAANLDVLTPKVWNVSASLRGFYDDNYNIGGGRGSAGAELTPNISINVPMQQTDIGLRYIYGLYYYQDRQDLGLNPFDQTHQVDFWLDHAFNTRWKINFTDSFAVGQEPELINGNPALPSAQVYRINGNNLANHANISLNTDWTRQFSTKLHYGNDFYDYENSGATLADIIPFGAFYIPPVGLPILGTGKGASMAGQLNRIEQNVALDLQWHFQPETMGFVGYQFSWVNYTANEPISYTVLATPPFVVIHHSADRDNWTQTGYVGVQHQFTPNLVGTVKGGVSYTDNYNDPEPRFNSTSLSPYADLNLAYTYLPGSYLQFGFTHNINSTDVTAADSTGHLTQYQESSVLYADINHRFTPKLTGTLIGRMQISQYQSGAYSAENDYDYSLGLDLSYALNRHFSLNTGYNYDDLVSSIAGRSFSRNRVYLGVTASY